MTTPSLALHTAGFAVTAGPAAGEVRSGTFTSAALGREVGYVVDLPASYDAAARPQVPGRLRPARPVRGVQLLGAARARPRSSPSLRQAGAVPEFLVVAVDGGNSFFVNAKAGRYEDLVTQDLVAHVEGSYRVVPGRAGRALLGISMGGYGALHIALDQTAFAAAVATHSAMLLETIPSAEAGARRGQMAAFYQVFGDPIDAALWNANDPLALARPGSRRRRRPRSSSTAEPRTATASRAATASCTGSSRSAASPTASSCRRATTATSSCARGSRRACASSASGCASRGWRTWFARKPRGLRSETERAWPWSSPRGFDPRL